MPMKNDEKIVINILESFKEKLVSKKQLARALRNVLQDKYSESIIVKLRQLLHFLHTSSNNREYYCNN